MTRKPTPTRLVALTDPPSGGLVALPAFLLSLILSLVLAGCNSYTTYPPIETYGKMVDPSLEPIPTLMTEAIRFAHDHYGKGETDFAINLPPGIPPEVYGRVLRKLGMGHPMTKIGEPAYHVLQVRVRGTEAEVDLIYPRVGSIYEMVTITFRNKLVEGWTVLSSRLWRTRVDVPGPNYRAPEPAVVPEPAPEEKAPAGEQTPPPADGGEAASQTDKGDG